jgi:hypothetical protein
VIITGTGRAGTTFLVQLLTELGMDTGFHNSQEGLFENCHAGMETDLRQENAPYIVKSPWICDYLEDVLRMEMVHIDHAIIPMRDLFSAAESRRLVSAKSPDGNLPNIVPGGLWDADDPQEQESKLAIKYFKLIYVLVEYNVPTSFLIFPKFISEPIYLYSKLWFLLRNLSYNIFLDAFNKVRRPELVHEFNSHKGE